MADMLSQEEINALLGGGDLGTQAGSEEVSETSVEGGNALATDDDLDGLLTSEEKDILGELGNISIGTSATTLFALLGQRVIITTPEVSVVKLSDIASAYEKPCVGIRVDYVEGIKGTNLLLLNQSDVKIITSLMMGYGGEVQEGDEELNEMDFSAIQEVMNQMIGSSSTSLASLVNMKIDIDTPRASLVDFGNEEILQELGFEENYAVCVKFRMEIGMLVDSSIMQLLPMGFARYMVETMQSTLSPEEEAPAPAPAAQPAPTPAPAPQPVMQQPTPTEGGSSPMDTTQPQAGYAPPPAGYAPPPGYHQPQYMPMPPVAAQPAQFQSFDITDVMQQKENIEIIMDVPLEVTVELGRTTRKIKDILEFSPGSIIELNKLAGEPIDILVNGKFVAKGEVVVIDENFGIRVTDIVNAEHRI
ncbi:MAG: flagellar motor switch phosphatase FliY [Defluviitaleaceae bacterium]|nr:flagellar motor switch phosphatase FliY [Defluviitaleaceae bacterium]